MPVRRVCHGDSEMLWQYKTEFLVLYVLMATLVSWPLSSNASLFPRVKEVRAAANSEAAVLCPVYLGIVPQNAFLTYFKVSRG